MQTMASQLGGKVENAAKHEFATPKSAPMGTRRYSEIFRIPSLSKGMVCWSLDGHGEM